MLLVAAVAALATMLIGGAGPAAAQTSPPKLAKTVKLTGTAKGGKKFRGTYTIQRFTRSGGKQYAVGTVKGKLKGRRVTRKNVKIPVSLERAKTAGAAQAPADQLPVPTQGACPVLNLVLGPIDLNLLGLRVATNEVRALVEAIPGPGNLLGNLLCGVVHLLDPQTPTPVAPGQLTQFLNALLALLPRGV
jgi:hypothetical protein